MKDKKSRFIEAYNNYFALIFTAVLRKVENANDAADICQDVFEIFYIKFDKIKNHRAWLYGTSRHMVKEYWREKGKIISVDEMFGDKSKDSENGISEVGIIIKEAMKSSSIFKNEMGKIIFVLIAIGGYSYAETGGQLGLTKRVVEYTYTQIRARFLDYLKKRGIQNLEDLK